MVLLLMPVTLPVCMEERRKTIWSEETTVYNLNSIVQAQNLTYSLQMYRFYFGINIYKVTTTISAYYRVLSSIILSTPLK